MLEVVTGMGCQVSANERKMREKDGLLGCGVGQESTYVEQRDEGFPGREKGQSPVGASDLALDTP